MTDTPPALEDKPRFKLVIHPFCFAILPLIKVWEACLGNYLPEQYAVIIAFLLMLAGVLLFISNRFLKDIDKAGLLVTLIFGSAYLWVAFDVALKPVTAPWHIDPAIVATVYLLLCANACVLAMRRVPAQKLTLILNLYSAIVVFAGLVPAVVDEWEDQETANKIVAQIHHEFDNIKLVAPADKPDIYYIIVDAFANPYTLRDLYGYDSALIKHLREKGFFIADHSFSNHDRTALSVPSSLNMRYMTDILAMKSSRTETFFRLLQDSSVSELLKRIGYRYVNVSSGWEPTDYDPFADDNAAYGPGCNLEITLFRLTVLAPFEEHFHLLGHLYKGSRMRMYQDIAGVKNIPGPKFVLAHTLLCHPPFFLDRQGNVLNISPMMMNEPYTKKPYLDQLQFGEDQLIKLVDTLTSDPKHKPIIVIQSDHGPGSLKPAFETAYANERMRILDAFYLPPPVTDHPPANITPVNIFRWVFNNYFGANFEMLPERAYASVPFDQMKDQKEITEYIKFPEK